MYLVQGQVDQKRDPCDLTMQASRGTRGGRMWQRERSELPLLVTRCITEDGMWKELYRLLGPMGGPWRLPSRQVARSSAATAQGAVVGWMWHGWESQSQLRTCLRLLVEESLTTSPTTSGTLQLGRLFVERVKVPRMWEDWQN